MTVDVTHERGQVAGLSDHFDVLFAFQQQAQRAAHQRVVVGKDDTDRLLAGRWGGGACQCGCESQVGHVHLSKLALERWFVLRDNNPLRCGKARSATPYVGLLWPATPSSRVLTASGVWIRC